MIIAWVLRRSVFIQETMLVPLGFMKAEFKPYIFFIHVALHRGTMVHLCRAP